MIIAGCYPRGSTVMFKQNSCRARNQKIALSPILTAVILLFITVLAGGIVISFVKNLALSKDELLKKDIESRLKGFEEKYVPVDDAHKCRAMQNNVMAGFVRSMDSAASNAVIATGNPYLFFDSSFVSHLSTFLATRNVYFRGPVTFDLMSRAGDTVFSNILNNGRFYIKHDPDVKTTYLILDSNRVFEFVAQDCGGKYFLTDYYEVLDPVSRAGIISNYTFSADDNTVLPSIRLLYEINAYNIIMNDLQSKIDKSSSSVIFYSGNLELLSDAWTLESVQNALDRGVSVTFAGNITDRFASEVGPEMFARLMDKGLVFRRNETLSSTYVSVDGVSYIYSAGTYSPLLVLASGALVPSYTFSEVYNKSRYNISSDGISTTWALFGNAWSSSSDTAKSYNNSRQIREYIVSQNYGQGGYVKISFNNTQLGASSIPYLFNPSFARALSNLSERGAKVEVLLKDNEYSKEYDKVLLYMGNKQFENLLTGGADFRLNETVTEDILITYNGSSWSQIVLSTSNGNIASYSSSPSPTYLPYFNDSFESSKSIDDHSLEINKEIADARVQDISRKLYELVGPIGSDFQIYVSNPNILLNSDIKNLLMSKASTHNVTVAGPVNEEIIVAYGGGKYLSMHSNLSFLYNANVEINMLNRTAGGIDLIVPDYELQEYNYATSQLNAIASAYLSKAQPSEIMLEPILVINNATNLSSLDSFTYVDISITNAGDTDTDVRIDMLGDNYSRCVSTNYSSYIATSKYLVHIPNASTVVYRMSQIKVSDPAICCNAVVKLYATDASTPVSRRNFRCLGSS